MNYSEVNKLAEFLRQGDPRRYAASPIATASGMQDRNPFNAFQDAMAQTRQQDQAVQQHPNFFAPQDSQYVQPQQFNPQMPPQQAQAPDPMRGQVQNYLSQFLQPNANRPMGAGMGGGYRPMR